MRILLVNDDGIAAKGINSLAKSLSKEHEVIVVAPEVEHSGASHALTFYKPLNYKRVNLGTNYKAFSIDGSPCDCVKFAVEIILGEKPDVVLSGINNCANIGTDALYSGTINAAIEGSMLGIKSIAFSLECTDGDYRDTCEYICKNLEKLLDLLPNHKTILSVNFPETKKEKIVGSRVAMVGNRIYKDEYQYVEGRGYIITGHPINIENSNMSDVVWFSKKYITISPIKVDFNDYEIYDLVKDIKL